MARDYDKEIMDNSNREYAYSFDIDVMHPYMLKSMLPFIKNGNALELGCYKGAFTRRLLDIFSDITCIEASGAAIEEARKVTKAREINFVHSLFEDAKLNMKYDNIILTHVLEHVEDRVGLLRKINDEWISNEGILFVVCPNAFAPSRQIAVKMGLISSCEAITEGEKEHGHRITYSFDTLREDINHSGLKIIHESGVFFKAFANFQWDKLMATDIISKEYLDGCYELGKEYPNLCSSILFVCKKGNK